jgi:hypothetical protein
MDQKSQKRLGIILLIGIALVAGYVLYAFPPSNARCTGMSWIRSLDCLKSQR